MRDTHLSPATDAGKPTKSTSATNLKEMTEMREQSVPCVNATHYEISRGLHMTWQDSGTCPRCDRTLDMFNLRIAINNADSEKEPVPH
jgi:hypothetical protein